MDDKPSIIAAAIVNARGGRRGMPPVVNVLELVPENIRDDALDDADSVMKALAEAGYEIRKKK